MARTLKLTIAYDGTDFAGWQRQARGRTVQAVIEDALAPIEGARVTIVGAGRTDAGVHAVGQVASVSLLASIPCHTLLRALNATIPDDVRVYRVEEVAAGFHAQFAARRKTYRYWIWSGEAIPPLLRRFVWHVPQAVDVDAMARAASLLTGLHDFAAFQAAGGDVKTTTRELFVSRVTAWAAGDRPAPVGGPDRPAVAPCVGPAAPGRLACYEITGSGFLRHMVRNIAGTLVEIGRGRRTPDDLSVLLASRDRARAAATAPAHGLVLWQIDY